MTATEARAVDRITIRLNPDQSRTLALIGRANGEGTAETIRRAVAFYLAAELQHPAHDAERA